MRIWISLSIIPPSRHAYIWSAVPAVMFESTQQVSFLIVFFVWWPMVYDNAGMTPASIVIWVKSSSPVTMLPIVLKHGITMAMFWWDSSTISFVSNLLSLKSVMFYLAESDRYERAQQISMMISSWSFSMMTLTNVGIAGLTEL